MFMDVLEIIVVDVSTFVSGDVDHSYLGPEVVVQKCKFFTCLESMDSTSGARDWKQNRGRSHAKQKPEGNECLSKIQDLDLFVNNSDQGTTEGLKQGRDQSGRFRGRGRGGGGGDGGGRRDAADTDVQGGLDDIQRSNQRSASVQRQQLLNYQHNQITDWNENNGNTIGGRLNRDTVNQVYEPDLTHDQMPHSGRQNLQYRRSGSIPNLTNLPLSTLRDDYCCFMDLGGERGRIDGFRRDFNHGTREDFNRGIQGDFNRGTKGEFNRGNRGGFSQGSREDFNQETRDFNRSTRTDSNLGTRGYFNQGIRGNSNQGIRRDFDRGTREFNQGTRTDSNQGTRSDFNQGTRGEFIRGNRGDFNLGNRGFNRGARGNSYRGTRDFKQGTRDFHQGTRGERQLPGSVAAKEEQMTETKSIDIKNEVQQEKCELLFQLTGEISRMHGCRVHVDKDKHSVHISGRDEISVTQTALLVHEKLFSMYSMKVSIGQRLAESLCCIKGYQWIEYFLMKNKFMASYYLNQNKEPEILAENNERAEAIALMLQKQVDSYRVPYNSSQKTHLQSEDWKKFVRYAEGNWLATIDVTDSEVCLEGVHPDFSLALNSIQYELTDNSRVTEAISMVVGKLRFLKTYHPDM